MFGGLCYLDRGTMAFGVLEDELMVRTGPAGYSEALAQPHAREMDFTGRALKGMVYVSAEGIAEDPDLQSWIARGLAFTGELPAKAGGAKKATKKTAGKTPAKKSSRKR